MQKTRPTHRVKVQPRPFNRADIKDGSFLSTIIPKVRQEPTRPLAPKRPVYMQDRYLQLLKRHYEATGVPFKDPQLPEFVVPPTIVSKQEPYIDYPDKVQVHMKIQKNGRVRIKLDSTMYTLWEKYYKKNIMPPFKVLLSTYKTLGFSSEYLEKMKKNNENMKLLIKRMEKVYTKIFEKEPVKKKKKEKEKSMDVELKDEAPEEDEEDEDDIPIEDAEMDVEPEEEDVEEEEYISEHE